MKTISGNSLKHGPLIQFETFSHSFKSNRLQVASSQTISDKSIVSGNFSETISLSLTCKAVKTSSDKALNTEVTMKLKYLITTVLE